MPAPALLLIPDAAADAPECRALLRQLPLPALGELLTLLQPAGVQRLDDEALDTPAERGLAEALALPGADGRWPWAALAAAQAGLAPADHAWALLTPCHLEVGMHQVRLGDPDAVRLDATAAEALLQAMAPYLAEDGIVCERWSDDGHWLAHGEAFRGMATASPARVAGEEDLRPWLPPSPLLRRLQNEMQMLLYTHPLHDARQAAGQLPVNAIWFSGCGALAAAPAAAGASPPRCAPQLQAAARRGDWAAWSQAWAEVDATHCAALLAQARAGAPVALELCGSRSRLRLQSGPRSAWSRLASLWRKPSPAAVLESL